MLIQEIVNINNKTFKHTYSSDSKYIKQLETGVLYDHAYDLMQRNFNYIETDSIIPADEIRPE